MKKIAILLPCLLFCCAFSHAAPYDNFNNVLNYVYSLPGDAKTKEKLARKYLDAFAKDVGQAISGGAYGVGGNLGFGDFNLTLSLKMSYQEASSDDYIVRSTGESAIYYPIVQAEIGLFEKLAGIARLSYFNNSTLLGGGLRYEILTSEDYMYVPTVSVQSVYNYLICDDDFGKFNAWNLKTGTTAYFGLVPYIQPYVFLTYDFTALKPVSSEYSYLSSDNDGFGYGIGANLSVEMLNLTFSISMYDNQPNYNFGVFIGI